MQKHMINSTKWNWMTLQHIPQREWTTKKAHTKAAGGNNIAGETLVGLVAPGNYKFNFNSFLFIFLTNVKLFKN